MREFNPFLLRHLGIYYMLIASFYNACLGFLAKILSQNLHSFEIVFWRNLIGLFIVFCAIKKDKECDFLRGGHMYLLLFRGFIGVCGMAAFFIISQMLGFLWLLLFTRQHRFLQL